MPDTSTYFDAIFNNAKANALMIMSKEGIIRKVNQAFTTAFGYTTEDLESKHSRILYIEKDQVLLRPEIELNQTIREGSSTDENYLVHKDGTPIWVTGESIMTEGEKDSCIIKIIHNIHAQKQLERYLLASNELMESLFHSVKSGLLVLDSTMRTIKSNNGFATLFGLDGQVAAGMKIQQIPHPFWSNTELKNDIRNALVKGEGINKHYIYGNNKDDFRKIHISSKLLGPDGTTEHTLLLVVKEE